MKWSSLFGSQVSRSTMVAASSYAAAQIVRLGGNLILSRLLFAEAFGAAALIAVLQQGLQMFTDLGLATSAIQDRRGAEPRFLRTVFSLQVLRGALIAAVMAAIAVPFAAFYRMPELAPLVALAGLGAAVAGLASTKIITQSRELMLGRLAAIELGSQVVGLVVTVGFAWWRPSVLALVVGGIAGNAVRATLSHVALPGERDRFGWDATAARHVVHFGKWLFLSTLLTFVAGQSDRLVFGKLIPLNLLGVYSIAAMISSVPLQLVSHVGASVVFPWYSRERNQGGELAAIVARVRPRVLLVGGFLISCLLASGDALIAMLYDARYSEAGWIVRLLSLACWFGMLEATNGVALLAHGSPRWVALGSAAKVVAMTATIPLGYHLAGFPGAVGGLVASELARYAVSARASATIGIRNLSHDFRFSSAIALSAAVASLLPEVAGTGGIHAFWRVLAGAAVAGVVWLPLALRAFTQAKAELAA